MIFAVGGVEGAERAARLYGICGDAVVDQAHHGDVLGFGEGRIGRGLVAERDRTPTLPSGHSARFSALPAACLLEIDQRRQQFVFDLDELGGILRLVLRFGNNECNAVADAATRSASRTGRVVKPGGPPQESGMKNGGMPPILSVAASAPVRTQSTPGAAFALVVSMLLIIACACGERTARHNIAAATRCQRLTAPTRS